MKEYERINGQRNKVRGVKKAIDLEMFRGIAL
jgi:hypothetical protein